MDAKRPGRPIHNRPGGQDGPGMRLYTIDWLDSAGGDQNRLWAATWPATLAAKVAILDHDPEANIMAIDRHHIRPPINAKSLVHFLNREAGTY